MLCWGLLAVRSATTSIKREPFQVVFSSLCSFRKLSVKVHPDRNKDINAEAEFTLVAEAYDTLSNRVWLKICLLCCSCAQSNL